jgi:hypothetical protein
MKDWKDELLERTKNEPTPELFRLQEEPIKETTTKTGSQ